MLGEAQWAWLAAQRRVPGAKLCVVASSQQLVSSTTAGRAGTWLRVTDSLTHCHSLTHQPVLTSSNDTVGELLLQCHV